MVGRGADSTHFSNGVTEFDSNFDGISEIESYVRIGELGSFSVEKRNLGKSWAEFRNWHNIVKIEGIDKNLEFCAVSLKLSPALKDQARGYAEGRPVCKIITIK